MDTIGEGYVSSAISAVNELFQRGMSTYQAQEAASKAKAAASKAAADDKLKTEESIRADAALAGAEANVDIVKNSPIKDTQRLAAAEALAQSATDTATSAGAGLSAEGQAKRLAVAQAGAQRAASEALAAPGNVAKAAKMRAWQKVSAMVKLSGPQASSSSLEKAATSGVSFLTKAYAGVPVWGWGLGGVAVLTGGVLLIRSMKKRK